MKVTFGLFCALVTFSSNIQASNARLVSATQNDIPIASFVIESLDGQHSHRYNVNEQADERFVPASTFKIPNTLIMLEEGAVSGPDDVIKWDGVEREYRNWNQDQTLKSAFQRSCVWCYQRYAEQLGNELYLNYLRKLDYGNHLTGPEITQFWLEGDLKISVPEQIDFLRRFYNNDLPIEQRHIDTLKQIMLFESDEGYQISAKTGWSGKYGWYVGYLEVDGQVWLFANHLVIESTSDLKYRKSILLDTFKQLGILP
ncbi:penicillin-binding transpeptidase domain-containing protein [Ferrimonas marina]|uniref:Beta-lactamase n=1 Tax=Ferrimonas marina TaxID=299255 RepID=A0A1M5MNU9_9GAMM|nr:penicillin-binding transpeptidase domain-containing protein [Ferrimonas marina]SHG78925.1 beta-lactamase class D [Ferrimonas marina]